MQGLLTIAHTVWIWGSLTIFLVLIALPLFIFIICGPRYLVANKYFMILSRLFHWFCIRASLLSITYEGLENLPQAPCIIAANHQSSFDIPLIGHALSGRPHIWLAWAELNSWPLLRPFLKRVALLVDVSSPIKAARSLIESIAILKKHQWDLVIFPEGARFSDGLVHPFFAGFATIARKTDRAVVPIKIIGINKVYPPNTWILREHPIRVIIGKPMKFHDDETDDGFKERVHTWFTSKD